MNLFTLLSRLIISILIILFLAMPLQSGTKIDAVYDAIKEHPQTRVVKSPEFGPEAFVFVLSAEEDITKFKYKWRWETHTVRVVVGPDGSKLAVEFVKKRHQKFATPGRGYEQIIVLDINADGKVDRARRYYTIVGEDNIIISPIMPKGFVNSDWYKVSEEEAQKTYEEEMNYWIKKGQE